MDRFSELRAFAAVVEAGGFSAAARDLRQSRSAVNRLVIALEQRLGVQLLHRTTRSVSPTSTGRALHERARRVLEDLEELETSASAARTEAAGKLRISVPPTVGNPDFSRLVVDFMARHPKVEIDATFDTRLVDPIAEGYDLAIRMAPPDEETPLVDHRLFEFSYLLCASRAYLDSRGTPSGPEDLRGHALVHQGSSLARPSWNLLGPSGPITVPVQPVLATNSLSTVIMAVRAGLGIGIAPAHEVRAEIESGDLRHVLPKYCTPARILQVIYPPSRHLSERVRLFTDFVAESCETMAGPA